MKEQDEIAPPPAEAATEVGQGDEEDLGSDFISDVAIAIMVLAVIAAIVVKAVGLI